NKDLFQGWPTVSGGFLRLSDRTKCPQRRRLNHSFSPGVERATATNNAAIAGRVRNPAPSIPRRSPNRSENTPISGGKITAPSVADAARLPLNAASGLG